MPRGGARPGAGRKKAMHNSETRVSSLARQYTQEALNVLVRLMRRGKSERIKLLAAEAILDRGWGKCKQEVAGSNGEPINVIIQNALAEPRLSPSHTLSTAWPP